MLEGRSGSQITGRVFGFKGSGLGVEGPRCMVQLRIRVGVDLFWVVLVCATQQILTVRVQG